MIGLPSVTGSCARCKSLGRGVAGVARVQGVLLSIQGLVIWEGESLKCAL